MQTILGTEAFKDKTIIAIGISHGIAGAKVEVPKGDNRSTMEGALAFFEVAGGKRFSLYFDDGTKVLWEWNKEQQAFIPVIS